MTSDELDRMASEYLEKDELTFYEDEPFFIVDAFRAGAQVYKNKLDLFLKKQQLDFEMNALANTRDIYRGEKIVQLNIELQSRLDEAIRLLNLILEGHDPGQEIYMEIEKITGSKG